MTTSRHPLLTALALGALLTPLSAQQDWVTWTDVAGVNPTDQFGTAIIGLGDLNTDGYDDYAISSIGSDRSGQNAGLVTIFSGFDDAILDQIDGLAAGDQLGFAMTFLGSHNGDGLPKFAIGAPFASSVNGPFSGLVRIYAWDNIAGSMVLNTELLGPTPGALFGFSLASFEMDGDNDLDLAIGAMGTNFQDGEVLTYAMSSAGPATPAANVYSGTTGSMEMFGWSLARGGVVGGAAFGGSSAETLIAGAPFADDLAVNAGAAVVLDEFGNQTLLSNPLAAVTGAHLGYSVAGGYDTAGDATEDYAAGAPDTSNGTVVVWDGSSLVSLLQIDGQGVGSQFGYSTLMSPDTNFDTYGDLVIGSPGALNQRGAFNVYSVANVLELGLFNATGAAGTSGNFGWSLGLVGDLNQTSKLEIGVGSPFQGNNVGAVDIFAPPAQDIGPIALATAGPFEWETDVQMMATNLSPGGGGEIYWYTGTTLAQTTSPHGYDLDIGGLIAVKVDPNPGDTAQQIFRILDTLPDGTDLYFQVIEDRNGFVRKSNTSTGRVADPGVTLFVTGNTAGAPITLTTRWGIPNSPVYIYGTNHGFTPGAVNNVPNGGWKVNLVNPRYIGQPGDKSGPIGAADEGVFTSSPINVPAGFAGVTAHFQAFDWDLFAPALTRVVEVQF